VTENKTASNVLRRVKAQKHIDALLGLIRKLERMADSMTKREALEGLSEQLRRKDLDDLTFVRLLTFYGRLQGWFK
jgi:hypothetical protein